MGVSAIRFPEYDLTILRFGGALTSIELIEALKRLDWRGVTRWIDYLDPTLDMSGLDLAHIPEVRRTAAALLRQAGPYESSAAALVTASPVNAIYLRFWPSYLERDSDYPVEPVAFESLEAACEHLGLSEAERRAVIAALEP